MDLSKQFNSITHRLLIGQMHITSFQKTIFCFSQKDKNQIIRINNTHSTFQILLSFVSHESILGLILFNTLKPQ